MKKIALIFAGGYGQRVGSDIPKQFLKVCGREIIIHTLELFELNDNIDEIYVVCVKDWIDHLYKLIEKYDKEMYPRKWLNEHGVKKTVRGQRSAPPEMVDALEKDIEHQK